MLYSVLIPQRNAADEVSRQVPELNAALRSFAKSHEIVCVDDGSNLATVHVLQDLLDQQPQLRVLRISEPCGLSAALSVGIAAARGKVLIAVEAGGRYSANQIPELVQHLRRADLVVGQRRLGTAAKTWQRIARVPRWLTLGLEARDPECLFWAARREAIEGIQLPAGTYRYLSTFVARRGFRVTEVYVEQSDGRPSLGDGRAKPSDLLTTWLLARRLQWPIAEELNSSSAAQFNDNKWRGAA